MASEKITRLHAQRTSAHRRLHAQVESASTKRDRPYRQETSNCRVRVVLTFPALQAVCSARWRAEETVQEISLFLRLGIVSIDDGNVH